MPLCIPVIEKFREMTLSKQSQYTVNFQIADNSEASFMSFIERLSSFRSQEEYSLSVRNMEFRGCPLLGGP